MKFPETLYVAEQKEAYPGYGVYLRGSEYLESMISEKGTIIAMYKLIRTETYKKTVETTVKVEKNFKSVGFINPNQ